MIIGYGLRTVVVTIAKRRLAANLQLLRERRGISQRELALRVGVNPSQVSHWENLNSSTFVGSENLTKLAEALQVDVADFFQESPGETRELQPAMKPTKAEVRKEAIKLLKRVLTKIGVEGDL